MDTILRVNSILKQFENIAAVNRLSFSIRRGEIFALLGPNGAGKTTAVRMLMNILRPDEGTIEFFLKGNDTPQTPAKSELGYLPEERGLYEEIPLIKSLRYMGIIRGMEKKEAEKAACEWLEKLNLLDRKDEKLLTLSKGNQQKVQFISSILHNPVFAILDEPFSGFDPVNQEKFIDIIKYLSSAGTTILLSAHQMQLVERIADRVILLKNGKKIAEGTVKEIIRKHSAGGKIIIGLDEEVDLSLMQQDSAVEHVELGVENELVLFLKQDEPLSGILNKISQNYTIRSVKTEEITLHDVFIEAVNKDKDGQQ